MQTGKTVEAIGASFTEGLIVAIAKELNPDHNMPQIIGNLTLDTIARVTGQPLQLFDQITILVSAEPSSDPNRYQWDINPKNGQVTIQLPEKGISAVRKLNSSFLQTAAAGALSVELVRRSTNLVTDADFQAFAAVGVKACGDILAEMNEMVRLKTGESVTLNLLTEPPETTAYGFSAIFG
jgi:hypothetical protein